MIVSFTQEFWGVVWHVVVALRWSVFPFPRMRGTYICLSIYFDRQLDPRDGPSITALLVRRAGIAHYYFTVGSRSRAIEEV